MSASFWAPAFIDVDPKTVMVACIPDGTATENDIWLAHFIGVKVADNPDGTIRVQVSGIVPDIQLGVYRLPSD
jgi:hypothetical protein